MTPPFKRLEAFSEVTMLNRLYPLKPSFRDEKMVFLWLVPNYQWVSSLLFVILLVVDCKRMVGI